MKQSQIDNAKRISALKEKFRDRVARIEKRFGRIRVAKHHALIYKSYLKIFD